MSRSASRCLRMTRRNGSRFLDRKSTRLNSSHLVISYAVFCLKKKIIVTLHRSEPSSSAYISRPMEEGTTRPEVTTCIRPYLVIPLSMLLEQRPTDSHRHLKAI